MWQPGATEVEIRLQFINIMAYQLHWLCRKGIKKAKYKLKTIAQYKLRRRQGKWADKGRQREAKPCLTAVAVAFSLLQTSHPRVSRENQTFPASNAAHFKWMD